MNNLSELQKWLLYTPSGVDVLANEQAFYCNATHNIFGYYAVQIGLPQINFLSANKINQQYIIPTHVNCHYELLPFAASSIDLIICPHILEFMPDYIQLLKECYRILIPQGKLIITSFNSSGLFSHWFKKQSALKTAKFTQTKIVQQDLCNIGFRIYGGAFFAYRPPFKDARLLSKAACLDKIINRWLPTMANCYGLVATKQQVTNTLILPKNPKYALKPALQLGR